MILLTAAALTLPGCAGGIKTYPVSGKVTFNGKEVPNGTISFIPKSGETATGEIRPDGSYRLTTRRSGDGAVPGTYTVVIVAMQDMGNRMPEDRTPLPPPIVPNKYTSAATTDLTAEVKEQDNTINFDLKGERTK